MDRQKEEHSYIFPKKMARIMAVIDQRTQYESALLSMTFIMIGMLALTIYMDFFTAQTLLFKIMFTFNIVCGFFLMGSFLITQFQSYIQFMQVMDEIKKIQDESAKSIVQVQQQDLKGGLN